MFQKLPSSQFN